MSEVLGSLAIKPRDSSLQEKLVEITEDTGMETFNDLLEQLGLAPVADAEGESIVEEVEMVNGYYALSLFGEEWIAAVERLVGCGQVAVWAKFWDEVGVMHYFSWSEGRKIIESVDLEEADAGQSRVSEIESKWNASVPDAVRPFFNITTS